VKYLITAIFILLASIANAATYSWAPYTIPADTGTVVGFRVYKNDSPLATFQGASITSGTNTDDKPVEGDKYYLTAVFADGMESGHSNVVVWHEGPKLIRIVK
jgi:hypothetical protein